jgi:hypothetical protein
MAGDETIARPEPAAAASMCKDNDTVRLDWKSKDALQGNVLFCDSYVVLL